MATAQGRKNSNSDIKKSQMFKTVGGKSCDKNEDCEVCSSPWRWIKKELIVKYANIGFILIV